MMRSSRTLLPAAVLALALASCASTAPEAVDQAPSEPHLTAGGIAFDPIEHDVEDTSVCAGEPGRTVLEEFDRAPWGELDLGAGSAVMTCGHADGAGWLHIADGHTDDYGAIAELVDSSWEDVAWFAIDLALENPTAVEQYADDIANYLLTLEYVDADGEVEQSWTVVVGVGLTSDRIITSFPRDS